MKDNLTWDDAHLLDYINEIECLYVPYMDDYKYRINIEFGKASSGAVNKIETPAFGYSEIATIFMNRFTAVKVSKQNHLSSADQVTVKKLSIREQDKVTKMLDNSPFIAYFSNIILDFFDTQNHIKTKRRKGANHSLKEIDLVSRLIYFSNLSKSKSWTVAESETLKAFLRQYKNYQYPNNISSVYPEFSVY